MEPRSSTQGSSTVLVLLGLALLIGISAWILWDPQEHNPLGPGESTGAASISQQNPDLAPVEAIQSGAPTRRDSTLVEATVSVILAIPEWAEIPETVKVELIPQGSNPSQKRHLWTRDGGRFVRFDDVPFGSWLARAAPRGFQATEVALSVSEAAPSPRQVLNLKPARSIRGRVLDETGATVPNVPVSARPVTAIPGFTVTRASAVTDAEGRYRLSSLPEGTYWVFAGELRSPIGTMVETQLVGDEAWADLTIPRLCQAKITVLNDSDQLPIPDLRVQAMRVGADGQPGHTTFQQTGPEGIVHFQALPKGEYVLTFLKTGFKRSTRRITVSPDSPADLSFNILPLAQ